MPEGPEVRRAADALHAALAGQPITHLSARTKAAKAWLAAHPGAFDGATVERVWSHGKHLVGTVAPPPGAADPAPLFFASHFMMWGRWHVVGPDDEAVATPDRRERARIVTPAAAALLYSAPVFEVGRGDPYAHVERLAGLGPDVLPQEGSFDVAAFHERLFADDHLDRTIGAVLLDQTVLAGVGNYLRAEILFVCRMDPWRTVRALTADDLTCLDDAIATVCARAYASSGQTVEDAVRPRLASEPGMTYAAPTDWNTRHYVFRRTNLPCLVCGRTVRQKKQVTAQWETDEGESAEKSRVLYFCPHCQGTTVDLPPVRKSRRTAAADVAAETPAADA